jgi:hypothetical protein
MFNSNLHRLSPCLRYLRPDYHHDKLFLAFFATLTHNRPIIRSGINFDAL